MLNKNKFFAYAAAAALSMALAGCSGGETKTDNTPKVDNGGGPTTSTGTGNNYTGTGTGNADLSAHSVYFDFDKSDIKPQGFGVITNWASYLTAHPTSKVRVEGNTDERGTREYNIGLGERRANAVVQALEAKGVSGTQLSVISYGKERPVALGHDESSWSQNRRADLVQQ
ncbi:MAG: peptidoglycan-associated lipoprotein Pal [Nevskia sp.]|nr:peptidoglycan-associated lipoprotein Pal [Nevskia sp.]